MRTRAATAQGTRREKSVREAANKGRAGWPRSMTMRRNQESEAQSSGNTVWG